ncbi:MAG TPA: hypothetical protein VFH61_12140, partial [Thermoleophilia bacterium]|nr:hypothetical protein [Thermoleophilia bacterium]
GVGFPANVTVTYRAAPGLPCVGLIEFTDNDGNRYFMGCDTLRLFQWQTNHWVDVSGADEFTGTEDDIFWMQPFENLLVLTNDVDPPKKYVPAGGLGTISDIDTDFDGDTVNDIEKAKIVLNHKGRLLYMNVQEKGVRYSHRVRRTQPNGPESFYDDLDYSDAPTGEAILSAGIVDDTVVCLCENNQTFVHRYRGDPKFLYDWVRISTEHGSAGIHSTVEVEGGLVVLSEFSIQTCDGRQLLPIDKSIPTWVRDFMDRTKLKNAVGVRYYEFDQVWMSLFKTGADQKSVLVIDLEKGAFSEYEFPYWVYGTARSDTLSTVVWDSLPMLPWDDPAFDIPWDAYAAGGESTVRSLFAGSRTGHVYLISRVLSDDDGNPIALEGVTQRLNPFTEQGMDASLGWVDFQLSRADGEVVTIKLYQNFQESEYLSVDVDLTGSGSARTVRRRVPSNTVAQFHSVSFHTMAPGFYVDSVELHCAPARAMQQTEVPVAV